MRGRAPLKRQIHSAWQQCIEEDYTRQRINSERSLQASFWAQLNRRLGANRRLFIEPRIEVRKQGLVKRLYPDIVICNTQRVIAVIELKYLPRARPRIKKDLESLALISKHRSSLSISNIRYKGPSADSRDYGFSNKVVFVWAGVHKEIDPDRERALSAGIPDLENCLLRLHAVTQDDGNPQVYSYE